MGSGAQAKQADNKSSRPQSSRARRDSRAHAAGFTLFELLVVLVIISIILGFGSPSFSDFRRNARLTDAANDLLITGQLARTEAIKRQAIVSICPSADPQDKEPACGGASFSGWITFIDTDGNCVRSEDEKVLRADGPLDPTVIANSNGSCISFGGNGFSRRVSSPGTASAILFCDQTWGTDPRPGTGLSAARGLMVVQTGRIAITRDKQRIDSWELLCER